MVQAAAGDKAQIRGGTGAGTRLSRVDWSCPEELLPYFRELPAPRTERVLVSSTEKLLATTHLEKEFALGTFSKSNPLEPNKSPFSPLEGFS